MSHVRRQIREAAAAAVTGLATTSTRVFQSRIYPLRDADLPCLLINTDDEDIESGGVADAAMRRDLRLSVRGVAMVGDALDDTLDGIAEQVEAALAGSTLGGLVKMLDISGIRVEMDDGVQKPVGVISLDYRATYFTTPAAPGTAL